MSLFVFIFRFEKEGVICGKQLGKLLRNIGQNPSEAEVWVLVMFVSVRSVRTESRESIVNCVNFVNRGGRV